MLSARTLEAHLVPPAAEACAYEGLVDRYGWFLNDPLLRELMGVRRERCRALDLGTGPGWIPVELARRRPNWELWTVDASAEAVAQARTRAAQAGVAGRLHVLHGRVEGLPFEAGSFDLVFSNYTLHHLEHPALLFDEAARVLRSGGQVVVRDLLRPPRWIQAAVPAVARHLLRYRKIQATLLRESLGSSLTIDEVRQEIRRSRLTGARVRQAGALHFVVTA